MRISQSAVVRLFFLASDGLLPKRSRLYVCPFFVDAPSGEIYDSQQLTDYRIGCVGTAFRLYKQMGEPLYCETMRLIVAAWEGKPDSFRASVLKGMMHFVELYHGEFNEERLLRALGSVHPMEIYRVGRDNPAKLPGWKKYVFPIYMAYNGKGRKDALSMKF